MADDDVFLVVNGRRHGGWKSIHITRTIESIAGSFALGVSDRWDGREAPLPIAEEDPCRVEIDDVVVIDGYIGKRNPSGSATDRSLSFTGHDRAAALVENSAIPDKWTYNNVTIADFAAVLAKPFGVRISVQAGLVLSRLRKAIVTPGDTPFEAIRRVAEAECVLLVSDGTGGVLITRAGTERAAPLIEGVNIKDASLDYDATDRFHRYVVASQLAGTGKASSSLRVMAQAIDEGCRRTDRVLLIRPERGLSPAEAKRRADWEARIRAERAEKATIVVRGWKQPNGKLWPVNAITRVQAPRLIGVDGDMRISQVDNLVDDRGGRITQLGIVRPDSLTPEPKAVVKDPSKGLGAGAWKELEKGAL